jgi:hypothetical protein
MHLVSFIIKKFVTMHGHMNVKNNVLFEVNMQCVNKDFRAGAISPTFSLRVSGPTYLSLLYFYA